MDHWKEEVVGGNNTEIRLQTISWRKIEWTNQAQFRAKQVACVRTVRNIRVP
jgi:hypothetical protein